jgi:hypothetical protein
MTTSGSRSTTPIANCGYAAQRITRSLANDLAGPIATLGPSIVDRRGKVTTFHASGAFNPPHNDALIAGLLSDITFRTYNARGMAA